MLDPKTFQLTLEQQFEMRRYTDASQRLSREEAIKLLLESTRQLMIYKNLCSRLMKSKP